MIQALTEAALFQPCAGVYRDLSRKKATLKGWQWKFFAKLFFQKSGKSEKTLPSPDWDESAQRTLRGATQFRSLKKRIRTLSTSGAGSGPPPSPGPLVALSSSAPRPELLSTTECSLCRGVFGLLMRRHHGATYATLLQGKSQEKWADLSEITQRRGRGRGSYPRASPDRPVPDRE